MKDKQVLLEIQGLHKRFGEIAVLDDITLTVEKGEVVVVLGPSGCGKSTLLRCLNGLEDIQSGDIRFAGKSLTDKNVNWQEIRQQIASFPITPEFVVL